MVQLKNGAAINCREGVYHARMRRLDTETPMDERPSVLRPAGRSSIVVNIFKSTVS